MADSFTEVLLNLTEKALFWAGGLCWHVQREKNEAEVVEEHRALSCMWCVRCLPQFICCTLFCLSTQAEVLKSMIGRARRNLIAERILSSCSSVSDQHVSRKIVD